MIGVDEIKSGLGDVAANGLGKFDCGSQPELRIDESGFANVEALSQVIDASGWWLFSCLFL